MFTGIIEEIGNIEEVRPIGGGVRLRIFAPQSAAELDINDSISISGVCHTVVSKHRESFEVESVEETLKKTSIGSLSVGNQVNLELPMRLNERLGGHLVLGHVDTVGTITSIEKRETSWMFALQIPEPFRKYVVPVGSVAVDGVSLTIAETGDNVIRVSIIPHTMERTIFKNYKIGSVVNLEFDIVGKYIERLLQERSPRQNEKTILTEQHLREQGF